MFPQWERGFPSIASKPSIVSWDPSHGLAPLVLKRWPCVFCHGFCDLSFVVPCSNLGLGSNQQGRLDIHNRK